MHVALGARVRRALKAGVGSAAGSAAGDAPASWRWPVDAALGGGVLGTVLFLLGAAGALKPTVVLAATLALAAVAWRELAAAGRELGAALLPRAGGATDATTSIVRALVAAFVALLLAAAVAPPTEWDSLMYHLRIPLGLLDAGRIATPADSFHVALIGSAHFATLPLLAAGIVVGPAVMQVIALALMLLATAALAHVAGLTRASGWLAGAMVIGCPVFALVAITARVDVTLVLALVAAHLALLRAADHEDRGALLVAAVLVGLAMSIKPQAGAYAIALVPLGWRAARGVQPALVAAGVAAAVALPWYVKNVVLTGAPLYPVGAPGWFEPWIAELYGTRLRAEGIDASVLRALPEARASFRIMDAFFEPGALTIEGEGGFYALSPLFLITPLVLFAWRSRSRAVGAGLVALVYAALVVVPFGRINLRYLMPMVPALAVAVAAAVEWARDRAGARVSAQMRTVLGVALVVFAMLPIVGAVRQRFIRGQMVLLRHAAGIASAQQVWRDHPDGTARELAPTIANLQRLVPKDGKVLMLWEARGQAFEREVLVDVMLSNWSYIAQSPGFANCLAGTGITHLLVNAGAVEFYVGRGADANAFMLQRFADFRQRCLTGHRSIGPGVEYFELRAPSAR